MPVTEYHTLPRYLFSLKEKQPPAVHLIHGEPYLYRATFRQLVDILLAGSDKSLNYEEIEGIEDNIFALTETLNTFSFLSGPKVIAYTDARIFYAKSDEAKLLEKARKSYDQNEMKKAVRHMASYLSVAGLGFEDIRRNHLKIKEDPQKGLDAEFFADLHRYAAEHNVTVPAVRDYAKILQTCIEKGFPKSSLLVITTDQIDKRKTLYKTIQKQGMVIDCSVPKGNRMADRKAQEAVFREVMNQLLAPSGKTIEPRAFQQILENTGYDLSSFAGSLKKLIDFSGTDARITAGHAALVLKRTKEDPIYELTNAVADRNVQQALFFLASLLSANIFPLQILAAIGNQMRKLAILKDFLNSPHGRIWNPGLTFPQFKSQVMPAVVAYDRELLEAAEHLDDVLQVSAATRKKKTKRKKGSSDLLIAKNPNNPYPVFQSLLKAEKFSPAEITAAMEALAQADMRLKSTPLNPKIVLEQTIIRICRKG